MSELRAIGSPAGTSVRPRGEAGPARDTSPTDVDLLRRYEPIIRYTAGELFFPVAIEDYLECCTLVERLASGSSRVVLGRGEVTSQALAEVGALRAGRVGLFLRLVAQPFSILAIMRWRRRTDFPRFRSSARLARVGVLSRTIDALIRASLLFRGAVHRGTQAAAETLYREQMRDHHHPYYGQVVRTGGYVALQYWFLYAFNDWRSRAYGVNDHEADWEQVTVYLAEQADGPPQPAWVVFSAHEDTGDALRRRWDDPDLTLEDDHPVVFAGLGSHAGAYLPGEYLTTVNPPAFHRLIHVFRKVTRLVLPWTRGRRDTGVGIPYIDYARGDGISIGPGTDRCWTPVVIGDETPWVFDYQGLWGNDTRDRFGGERGPAGPRYERSGAVRRSWGEVVEWSGLGKVPPSPTAARELIGERLEELAGESEEVQRSLAAERARLRADIAGGVRVEPERERILGDLAAKRVALGDERRRLRGRLDRKAPEPGPHDHLPHRRLPIEREPRQRLGLLKVWSALSTPLMLTAIGLAFWPGNTRPVKALALFWLAVLLSVEALARGRLLGFVLTVVAIVVGFSLLTTLAGLTFYFGWPTTVAIVFFGLALVLLAANLFELGRR